MTGTISCKVKRQFGLRPYDPTPASYAVGKKDFRRSLGFWSDFSLFFPVLGTEFRTFPTYGRHVLFYQATLLAHPGLGGSKQRDCELCLLTAFGSSSPLGTKH